MPLSGHANSASSTCRSLPKPAPPRRRSGLQVQAGRFAGHARLPIGQELVAILFASQGDRERAVEDIRGFGHDEVGPKRLHVQDLDEQKLVVHRCAVELEGPGVRQKVRQHVQVAADGQLHAMILLVGLVQRLRVDGRDAARDQPAADAFHETPLAPRSSRHAEVRVPGSARGQ